MMPNAEQAVNEEARGVLAFLDAMVPVLHVAERTDALLQRKMGTKFRIAKYAVNGELSLNQIFADLLNPRGPHGQGAAFLKLFVEMLPGDMWSDAPEEWRVVASHRTETGRYVDLALFCSDVAIYIECKPWAEEGHKQLGDYAEDLLKRTQRGTLVFVPGQREREPKTLPEALKRKLGETGFQKIPFQPRGDEPSIIRWLEQCVVASEADNVRVFINDLRQFLRDEFGEENEASMTDDPFISMLKDHVRENKDRLKMVLNLERLARELRRDIPTKFLRDLGERLERELGSKWVVDWKEFDAEGTYRKLWLRKGQWPYHWGIALESESVEFRKFLIGFCCPSSAQHLRDLGKPTELASEDDKRGIQEVLENPLRQIGGSVRQTPWWPAWVYLPDPFNNWNTGETVVLLSGLEPPPDGRTASDTFVKWFRLLANAELEAEVEKILAQHSGA
ncbi:MAG: PD-(D/E)XK nuclease family protein [Candidatus Binataceae bacterium]